MPTSQSYAPPCQRGRSPPRNLAPARDRTRTSATNRMLAREANLSRPSAAPYQRVPFRHCWPAPALFLNSAELPMILAIFHTREFRDYAHFERALARLRPLLPALTKIITTGAPGTDPMGARYARAQGLPLQVLRPDYRRFGREARLLLNERALKQASGLVAFWDESSPSTGHALRLAQQLRLPYVIKVPVANGRPKSLLGPQS